MGISLLLKGLGVFPLSVRGWGASALEMSICSFLYLFCSALCLMFRIQLPTTTPPVMVVSSGLFSMSSVTVAPSLTGFPVSLDQHGMVPPPPLMPRGSGGVTGSVSMPQQQPPSSMPPLAYANYAMGSPQGGFFFRVEPPIIYILYMFGVCSGVCFLLLGAKLDAIFTYGGSTIRVCTLATLWSLPMAGICAT